MVHMSVIEARLSKLGFRVTRLFRPEVKELQHILMDHEKIVNLVAGRYFGGYALLVATDLRILLIDKKMLFLTVEDIRYDMISEIAFSSRLFDATVSLFTVNKQHRFTAYKSKHQLRQLATYAQHRLMEIRQYSHQNLSVAIQQPQFSSPQFQPQQLAPQQYINEPQAVQQQLPDVPQPLPEPSPGRQSPPTYSSQLMGATAIQASSPWISSNPYTKNSLTSRRKWVGSWSAQDNTASELS